MKINNSVQKLGIHPHPQTATSRNQSSTRVAPERSRQATPGLTVNLAMADRIAERIAETPDMDMERVAIVKQQLAEGTYRVAPEELAERMLDTTGGLKSLLEDADLLSAIQKKSN